MMNSRPYLVIALVSFMAACGQEAVETYSFKEEEYKFAGSSTFSKETGIGDMLVHQKDTRLSMTRDFYPNEQKREEHFSLDDKPFGPQRLYDSTGKLVSEKIAWGQFDSTKCVYEADEQVMKCRK